jgi:hypothetical protein
MRGEIPVAITLLLKRDSGYADRIRQYRVLLDGTEIGRINDGEEKRFAISPGQHDLAVKIDWCRTDPHEFSAVDGETVTFDCGSNLRGIYLVSGLYYALFARSKYLWLKPAVRS